jgi:hypothetical protein
MKKYKEERMKNYSRLLVSIDIYSETIVMKKDLAVVVNWATFLVFFLSFGNNTKNEGGKR